MSNAVISVPGEQVTKTYGRYQITAQTTVDGGYAINTFTATGGHREHDLCFSTADRDTYRLVYAVIREGGLNNFHPDGVRDAIRDALTRDLHGILNRRGTVAKLRRNALVAFLDRLDTPAERAAMDALAADINASLGRSPVRTLADTVPAGIRPQVPPSRTGVEYKPLTGPQTRIISGHINGIIYAGPGISWVSLRSIARKGYTAEVHYVPGTQRIASIVLNKQGRAAAVRTVK